MTWNAGEKGPRGAVPITEQRLACELLQTSGRGVGTALCSCFVRNTGPVRRSGMKYEPSEAAKDLLGFANGQHFFSTQRADSTTFESAGTPMPQRVLPFARTTARSVLACQSNLEFMKPLKSGSMKLIVTSPPYNIGKAYERRTSMDRYLKEQAKVIAECVRLLHPKGSICWQVGNHVQDSEVFPLDIMLYPVFRKHGLKLRNRIVWHFEHGLHCSKRFSGRHETILWFTKGD